MYNSTIRKSNRKKRKINNARSEMKLYMCIYVIYYICDIYIYQSGKNKKEQEDIAKLSNRETHNLNTIAIRYPA